MDIMTNNDTLLSATHSGYGSWVSPISFPSVGSDGGRWMVGLCSAKRQNTDPDTDRPPVSGSRQLAHRSKCHGRMRWISAD